MVVTHRKEAVCEGRIVGVKSINFFVTMETPENSQEIARYDNGAG